MKIATIVFTALVAASFTACITDDNSKPNGPIAPGMENYKPADSASLTTIQWIDSVKNLNNVIEGQKVEVVYRFKNTGSKPLVIESAQPSCGCTVPSKPEEPIMPGGEGVIKAIFDSQGRPGSAHKTITVRANTKPTPTHQLEFNLQVLGKKDGPKAAPSGPQGL
jgi:hypothetical protein